MTEFNKGDKVRVISDHTLNGVGYGEVEVGDTVMVVGAIGLWDVPTYHVRRAGGGTIAIDATCLELVYVFDPGGENIAFGDVKAGDTIAALTYSQWRVAEVGRALDAFLSDTAGERIAYGDSDTTDIRLLHRPEPKVDPAKVQAVTAALRNAGADHWDGLTNLAAALVKAGVSIDV